VKKGFGSIHYSAFFFDRVLSKSVRSPGDAIDAFRIASRLLKELDSLQARNPLVTLSFATDSLRVYHRGQLQFHIQARKCRTIIWIPYAYSRNLAHEIQKRPQLFPDEMATISWILSEKGVDWLLDYLRAQWKSFNSGEARESIAHSRYIPGDVRQSVLSEFLASGRWCPGVAGMSERHKVSESPRRPLQIPPSVARSNSPSRE
jgi:hypothetical protein